MAPLIDLPAAYKRSIWVLPVLLLSSFLSTAPQLAVANTMIDIVQLGAVGDGKSDATAVLLKAWSTACQSQEPATITVPVGVFLVTGPVTFQGPCNNQAVELVVEGSLAAAANFSDVDSWLGFEKVQGVFIHGNGTIDGQGAALWNCKTSNQKCPTGPKSLAISHSQHVNVSDLTFVNSKFFHIYVGGSSDVHLQHLTIRAPGDSPNTDGIHIQESDGVSVTNTDIRTGDDCISIGPGSTNILADTIFCGPGHGISIGSLGNRQSEPAVTNIWVKNAVFDGTQNGVRIKTRPLPSTGSVDGVTFQGATMSNVKNPIVIDQNYCPHPSDCPKAPGAVVMINNVTYSDFQGTSPTQTVVNFDCTATGNGCTAVNLHNINLTYTGSGTPLSVCNHVTGTATGFVIPPSCL